MSTEISKPNLPETLDIGCGMKKTAGSYGIDIHQYDGVDKVVNLNQAPWDIPDASFSKIVCLHVIEHVEDITVFMREIHRISKNNAEVYIETPHFSSINSWSDPTHRSHFSSSWYRPLESSGYLSHQTGAYEKISSIVTFGKSFRAKVGKFITSLRGIDKWEKNYAFTYPGLDVQTWLRVVK